VSNLINSAFVFLV